VLGSLAGVQWALVCNHLWEEQLVTKKDFELIARLFQEARSERYTTLQTIKLFGNAFAEENERFDYERFVKACSK
jgi:hypothetical protein